MMKTSVMLLFAGAALFSLGFWMGRERAASAFDEGRVFEIRTYTANEGKLDVLHARFRKHTLRLFEKHGMQNICY